MTFDAFVSSFKISEPAEAIASICADRSVGLAVMTFLDELLMTSPKEGVAGLVAAVDCDASVGEMELRLLLSLLELWRIRYVSCVIGTGGTAALSWRDDCRRGRPAAELVELPRCGSCEGVSGMGGIADVALVGSEGVEVGDQSAGTF